MVELKYDHDGVNEPGGKQLWHVAVYEGERPGPGPNKRVTDVVTDDGTVYRFEQLRPGEPWSFSPGNGSDNRVSRTGRLPKVVETIADADWTDDDGDPDPGWMY